MDSLAVKGPNAQTFSAAAWLAECFWPVAGALLLIRCWLDARFNLVPDEAFYWTWTRHLNAGYFDHPPMIAWLMWLSTRVMGDNELAVRFPATLLSLGSLAILYLLARKILNDARAVGYIIAMWIAGPLLAVMGSIFTPDAPATFFSMCALAMAVLIARRDDRGENDPVRNDAGSPGLWLLFGLFCGLAFLSKYTTVLAPAGVGLALLTSRAGRNHLRRPWIYLAALVAVAVFSPNIYWNAKHQWASFAFQLHHGAGGGLTENVAGAANILLARACGLGEFIGGQALVWTPILFLVSIRVLFSNWRKYSRLSNVDRMLLWSGTLPLIFFGWAATRSHGEINWPAFAYFPISLLIGRYLSAYWAGYRVQWVRIGCTVALGFTVAVHVIALQDVQHWILRRRPHLLTHQVTDLWGWREFGAQLAADAHGLPVVCNRHQDAGEAAFYMPGRPDVWCEGIGSRPTAFDYFDRDRPDYARIPELLFVGGNVDKFMAKFGYTRTVQIFRTHSIGRSKLSLATRVARTNP